MRKILQFLRILERRTVADIMAPLTRLVDDLKRYKAEAEAEADSLVQQANVHFEQAKQAAEHLDKLSAIFGK